MLSKLLRRAMANYTKAYFGVDQNGDLLWMNASCGRMFPDLLEGTPVEKCFPDFGLEDFQTYLSQPDVYECVRINRRTGTSTLHFQKYESTKKGANVYVGDYSEGVQYPMKTTDVHTSTAMFLSYVLREKTSNILYLSDVLREAAEKILKWDEIEKFFEIDQNCRILLQLSYLFYEEHREQKHDIYHPGKQKFYAYFDELMDKCARFLSSSGLHFRKDNDQREGLVELDEERFSVAILNLIRFATGLEGTQEFFWKTEFSDSEVMLTIRISGICADAVLQEPEITFRPNSHFPQMKQASYLMLQKVARLHQGDTNIFDAQDSEEPVTQLVVRLPAESVEERPFLLEEPSGYTTSRHRPNKLERWDIVQIMLGDIGRQEETTTR